MTCCVNASWAPPDAVLLHRKRGRSSFRGAGQSSCYNRALDIAIEVEDPRLQTDALEHLAIGLEERGAIQDSIEYYERMLSVARKSSNDETVTIALRHLGDVHATLEEYDDAIAYYQQALKAARALLALRRAEAERELAEQRAQDVSPASWSRRPRRIHRIIRSTANARSVSYEDSVGRGGRRPQSWRAGLSPVCRQALPAGRALLDRAPGAGRYGRLGVPGGRRDWPAYVEA